MRSGGRTLKNVSGYDFTRLAWRSRGRLALVTGFILKLLPRPTQAPVLAYARPTPAEAAELARLVLLNRLAPEALRLVWDETGETRLLVWLTGFPEEVAARETALAALAGGRPDARHDDGFAFWRDHGRRWLSEPLRPLVFLGARRDLLAWAATRPAPRADFDLGGGRAILIPNPGNDPAPTAAAHRLWPDGFRSSGPVYERLKAGLDPRRVFYG